MVTAWLFRTHQNDDHTLGVLWVQGERFYTLEPPWRGNQRNISCIPSNYYDGAHLARSASGKYTNVYHVKHVPDRTGILVHNGNVVDHTLGCILIGTKRGRLAGKAAVLNSNTAKRRFADLTGKRDIKLIIVGGN